MLDAGEDPLYVARRLVRFASEDVGNADPGALRLTLDAKEAYHFLGTPEGELALAQATCYLALAPKSNAVYAAWNRCSEDIREQPAEPVPLHLRNAPTGLMATSATAAATSTRTTRPTPGGPGAPARRAARARLLPSHRARRREARSPSGSPRGGSGGGARHGRDAPRAAGAAKDLSRVARSV